MLQNSTVADNSDTGSASAARRQQLANELRAVQEKMVDLEDLERHTISTVATRPSAPRQLLRLVSMRSTSTTTAKEGRESQDLVAQLEASRQRNELLAARIRELEEQMHSPWALGLSDEPPPGYTPEPSNVEVP